MTENQDKRREALRGVAQQINDRALSKNPKIQLEGYRIWEQVKGTVEEYLDTEALENLDRVHIKLGGTY